MVLFAGPLTGLSVEAAVSLQDVQQAISIILPEAQLSGGAK